MRRVVVTGLGIVTPLGVGIDHNWSLLTVGKSGVASIQNFDVSDLACKIAGQVPLGSTEEGKFNADDWLHQKDQRKNDKFIHYAIAAATQALKDADWLDRSDEESDRTGVIIGSGVGGLNSIYETSVVLYEKGPKRISPFFIPSTLINLASGQISIKYNLRGPNHAVVTACSTGAHAIGDAARIIQHGDADVMVAGGAEAAIGRIGISGFLSARALSTNFNDTPQKASRPWDKDRDGFVMGEGSGILILEEYEHAKKRDAHIYAELAGYGLSGDAYHITAPSPDGNGAYRSMKAALSNAKVAPEEIDYINAHGTSTPVGDEIELKAAHNLFGDHSKSLSMSSTKSSIGHLLGAAGSVEAIYSIKAINDNIAPATLNLENSPEDCHIDLVPNQAKEKEINCALSNSFGFGGTNATLLFKKVS